MTRTFPHFLPPRFTIAVNFLGLGTYAYGPSRVTTHEVRHRHVLRGQNRTFLIQKMTVAHVTCSCHAGVSVHASVRPSSVGISGWVSSGPCQRTQRTRKSVKSNLNFDVAVYSYSLFAYCCLVHSPSPPVSTFRSFARPTAFPEPSLSLVLILLDF